MLRKFTKLAAYYATHIFRPFSDRFQSINFRENGLKTVLMQHLPHSFSTYLLVSAPSDLCWEHENLQFYRIDFQAILNETVVGLPFAKLRTLDSNHQVCAQIICHSMQRSRMCHFKTGQSCIRSSSDPYRKWHQCYHSFLFLHSSFSW